MSRIYTVSVSINSNNPPPVGEATVTSVRLVLADNPAQARNFVTRDSIVVRYAEQEELALLVSEGVVVEDATDPNALQPTMPGV